MVMHQSLLTIGESSPEKVNVNVGAWNGLQGFSQGLTQTEKIARGL